MKKKEILLKIKNDKIWFNNLDFIEITFTNIPYKHLFFKSNFEIYWKVEMKEFDKNTNKLFLDILNYSYDEQQENLRDGNEPLKFLNQKLKKEIKYLEFGKFNWTFLEPQLSNYQIIKFIHQLTDVNEIIDINKSKTINSEVDNKTFNSKKPIETIREPIVETLEEEFAIDFNDSSFMLGYVKFTKHIKKINKTIDFKIVNNNILHEFDNIKYWFSRKLKTKKFTVKAFLTLIDNQFKECNATSKDIDKIDQNLIEGVKLQRTLKITKSIRPLDIDKALFTSDDFYSLDNKNDLEGNVFKQSERDILDLLIFKSNVRNKKELSYLSGSKQSLNYRIRFTNHPNFGFIFLVEGELNNHFIWELLNSHATYIWTIEKGKKEIDLQYKRIENTINTILDCGREKYKRAYQTTNQDNDLILNVIYHKNKTSPFIDEFPKWKHRINALIT